MIVMEGWGELMEHWTRFSGRTVWFIDGLELGREEEGSKDEPEVWGLTTPKEVWTHHNWESP